MGFQGVGILCCRNLLIYVNAETQKKLLPLMHYALNPGGLLVLGSAESASGFGHLFSPLDRKWKVFQRIEVATRPGIEIATIFLGNELAIKRFTPEANRIVHLVAGDVGRPLSHFATNLKYDRLVEDAKTVLGRLGWTFSRAIPLLDADGNIVEWFGAASDITGASGQKSRYGPVRSSSGGAIEEAPIPIIMHAEDGQVLQISRTWTELTGYTFADMPTLDAWLNLAYGEGAGAVRTHMRELFFGRIYCASPALGNRPSAGWPASSTP